MKKHLNTLFVTTQGAYLSKEGETVVVKAEKEVLLQLPIHTIGGIVCFGQVSCSPFLMGFCAEQGVSISFLSEHGRFLARVQGPVSGNVLLRRQQYRWADDEGQSVRMAGSILVGKVANCRSVLGRTLRDHSEKVKEVDVRSAYDRLKNNLQMLTGGGSLDVLRGIEGDAAHTYFRVFDHLILSQKEDFTFAERNRRPPLDRVNCLLSFLYTLLMHDVRSALECVGLDPAVGFLHRDRPGRPGLALDLMEEFRPLVVDSAVLSAVNTGMVTPGDFETGASGCLMKPAGRKALIQAYEQRLDQLVTHPIFEYRCSWRAIVRLQARLLSRWLRGDVPAYQGITTR